MFGRQVDSVTLGLGQGVAHKLVITGAGRGRWSSGWRIPEIILFLVSPADPRLLCLKDETAALIQVSKAGAPADGTSGDRPIELIMAQLALFAGAGCGQIQCLGKFGKEKLVIGALCPALNPKPFMDKCGQFHVSATPPGDRLNASARDDQGF